MESGNYVLHQSNRASKSTTTTSLASSSLRSSRKIQFLSSFGRFFHLSQILQRATVELTEDDKSQLNNLHTEQYWNLPCPITGCAARLSAMEDFEDHYFARHTATCSVCSRAFPTTRLLNIHVAESHDSFFQAKVGRGYPMYECLVEGCGTKFTSDKARHQHLVDKHKFPVSYEFHKRCHPSKRQRQKLRAHPSTSSTNAKHPQCADAKSLNKNDDELHNADKELTDMVVEQSIEDLASAVSKLSTHDNNPEAVSFGHRHNRAFAFVPRSVHGKTR